MAFVLSFIALFVAMDIVGTIPLYLSMTRSLTREEKNQIVDKSMVVAFVTAVVFVVAGRAVFKHIGISLADFRIAGGIILLLVALADLVGGPEQTHNVSGSTGIVPLAVPLITGPGVLTAVVLQVGVAGYPITLLALVANYALAWVLLRKSEAITRIFGKDGTVALSKIAALLLAAIAVSMIRAGVFESILDFQAFTNSK